MNRYDYAFSEREAGEAAKYPCKLVVAIVTRAERHTTYTWPYTNTLALLSALNEYMW